MSLSHGLTAPLSAWVISQPKPTTRPRITAQATTRSHRGGRVRCGVRGPEPRRRRGGSGSTWPTVLPTSMALHACRLPCAVGAPAAVPGLRPAPAPTARAPRPQHTSSTPTRKASRGTRSRQPEPARSPAPRPAGRGAGRGARTRRSGDPDQARPDEADHHPEEEEDRQRRADHLGLRGAGRAARSGGPPIEVAVPLTPATHAGHACSEAGFTGHVHGPHGHRDRHQHHHADRHRDRRGR